MKSFEQNQMPEGGGGGGMEGKGVGGGGMSQKKLTKDDARKYLNEVKEIFQDQKETYNLFLEILKDFRDQRSDVDGVIAQVKELLKDHKNLIYGFNMFLPKGYEISLDEDEHPSKQDIGFEEAISFVKRVKKRFQNDENVYKSFQDILILYRNGPKDIIDVCNKISALFQDHPDLLEEFRRFLPDSSAVARRSSVVVRFDEDDPDQHDIRRDLLQYVSATQRIGRNTEGSASSDDRDTLENLLSDDEDAFSQLKLEDKGKE